MYSEDFFQRLKKAHSVLFFTGAGMSAESGISTFRGEDGIWNKLRPEELASFDAFMRNPDMVWEWYQYRRKIISESSPNPGHEAIAEFEKYFREVTVVTQNVDNLHVRAGSTKVLELHGNIERNFCIDCRTFFELNQLGDDKKVPKCSKCGGFIRPDVVWFGEMLPQDAFRDAESAAERSDICFIVGTSAVVYPAAYIPVTAKSSKSFLVEVNIEETEMTRMVDYSIIGKAGEVLPGILEIMREGRD